MSGNKISNNIEGVREISFDGIIIMYRDTENDIWDTFGCIKKLALLNNENYNFYRLCHVSIYAIGSS